MTFGNQLKTMILLASLTALVLFVGSMFGTGGLLLATVLVVGMNFISYFYSDKIVLKMYKAQEVKDPNHKLYKMCQELAQISKLPMPKVYIIPDSGANAFATGRNPKHAAVAATQGIMNLLDDRELKGVMAHEFAHIKNRDILISSIAGMIAGVIAFVAEMQIWSMFFGGHQDDQGHNAAQLILLMILAPLTATLIQMAISRSREYMADATGAKFVRDGESLATALEKLHQNVKRNPLHHGNDATAHMFIVNPFKAGGLHNLFSTHPPYKERARRLRNMHFTS